MKSLFKKGGILTERICTGLLYGVKNLMNAKTEQT